jgi:alkylation response protein AidB-like acyl-CoA dehydrogenase
MDFAVTPEQEALRRTAREYLRDRYPLDALASLADPGPGWDARSWPELVALGWLDPDLGPVELGLLAEETGYALHPGPWLPTVALAAPAFHAAGDYPVVPATLAWSEPTPGPRRLPAAAGDVRCRARAGTVTGRKIDVPAGADVSAVVVVAHGADGVELHLVDPLTAGVEVAGATVDPTRPSANLDLSGTPARALVPASRAAQVLCQTRVWALALLACEAVGVARRALDLACEHAKTRTQFGRPIGANQAVSHPLAEVYASVELARSLAYRAAWSVSATTAGSSEAVLTATVAARRAARDACEAAIQTLGGIGFTWEHPIHRWYRRALWHDSFEGSPSDLRAELAALLLDGAVEGDLLAAAAR